jgi:bacillithiol biosynthesis cysteine-adding enzyme BshC
MPIHKIDSLANSLYPKPVLEYLSEILGTESSQQTNFKKTIANRNFSIRHRNLLVEELRSQYADLKIKLHQATVSNLELLAQENTFTVTTGHQLCLFTGPLYFVYKILSAIKLCSELKDKFPDYNFVPVYWMATEDHDFDEINHIYLKNKKFEFKPANYIGGACGNISTVGIDELVQQIESEIPEICLSTLWIDCKTAYLQSPNLKDAVFKLVNGLLAKYGLLIIDANKAGFKSVFSDFIQKDITNQVSFQLVSESIRKRNEAGLSSQIQPREINFFYLMEGLRERIVFEDNTYKVLKSNYTFNSEQLKTEIELHPERFSPNVITRPLYQEVILPNIAYVGGPAELNYWLQLKSVFEYYQIPYPLLVPRDSFYLLSDDHLQSFIKLGFAAEQIFHRKEELLQLLINKFLEEYPEFQQKMNQIRELFSVLKAEMVLIDKGLEGALNAAEARLAKIEANLKGKLKKSLKRKHQDSVNVIEKIFTEAFPGSVPQERRNNILEFSGYFEHDFFDMILENSSPLELKFKVITV